MYIGIAPLPDAGIGLRGKYILLGRVFFPLHDELERPGIDERGKTVVGKAELEGEVLSGGEIALDGKAVQDKTVADTGQDILFTALVFPVGGHGARA